MPFETLLGEPDYYIIRQEAISLIRTGSCITLTQHFGPSCQSESALTVNRSPTAPLTYVQTEMLYACRPSLYSSTQSRTAHRHNQTKGMHFPAHFPL